MLLDSLPLCNISPSWLYTPSSERDGPHAWDKSRLMGWAKKHFPHIHTKNSVSGISVLCQRGQEAGRPFVHRSLLHVDWGGALGRAVCPHLNQQCGSNPKPVLHQHHCPTPALLATWQSQYPAPWSSESMELPNGTFVFKARRAKHAILHQGDLLGSYR